MPETIVEIKCSHCGKDYKIRLAYVTQAKKKGLNLYCSKVCSGLGRRHNKSVEQLKKEKAEYDAVYRNRDYVKQRKHEAFLKDYAANPEKYKKERQRRYKAHLEYLRRPEYKEWKKEYDQNYRLAKEYGEFSEAAKVLIDLEKHLESKQIKYDIGILNKSQKRKRQCQKTNKL